MQLCDVFRARMVDVAPETLMVEITGAGEKIDGLIEMLRSYGVIELVRTGAVAMTRGHDAASAEPTATPAPAGSNPPPAGTKEEAAA
jgi:acetolactate synthase-1/3 small subunit